MVDGAAAADTAAAATEEEREARLVARISAAVAEQTAAVVSRLQREIEVLTENAARTDPAFTEPSCGEVNAYFPRERTWRVHTNLRGTENIPSNVTEVFRVHEHCLHVLKSKYHMLGGQQRIEADVLYTVNSFMFDIIREMVATTEFLPDESPQKARLGRLARWLCDLEELISDRFTEILSRDSHPELVAVQKSIGTPTRDAATLPSRTRGMISWN